MPSCDGGSIRHENALKQSVPSLRYVRASPRATHVAPLTYRWLRIKGIVAPQALHLGRTTECGNWPNDAANYVVAFTLVQPGLGSRQART